MSGATEKQYVASCKARPGRRPSCPSELWCSIAVCIALVVGCSEPGPGAPARARGDASGASASSSSPRTATGDEAVDAAGGSKSRAATGQATSPSVAGSDSDWPGFRGPSGMGTSPATGLPLTWSATENMAWMTELPGPGASSPIVWGDRIYITCYTGYFVPGQSGGSQKDLKRHLIAIRRSDGGILWDQPLAAVLPEESRIREHGFAASTPAADNERVYVFFGKSGVFAFDHNGQEVWRADVGSKTHGWGSASSPVLYQDLVFINASVESSSLVALDRRTGEEKWRAKGVQEAWNTPLVITADGGREELVLAAMGSVLAFDPATGDKLWSCNTDIGWYMVPSVVAADGIVYCLGGRSGIAALAVRTGGGGNVTRSHRLWTSVNGSNVSSPVFLDGQLYWMHDSSAIAFCAVAETGEVVYEKRVGGVEQVYSSALLADGRLYYLARDGKTIVVAARPEFEVLAENDLQDGSIFNGSPAVDGSRILIRSDKYLYCIGQ